MKDALEIGPDGDISTWPHQKLARARAHAHELISAVDAWNARNLYKCPVALDRDQRTIRILQVDVPNDPAVDWAISFGDALHNVRVALDGLAWDLAHLEGAIPPSPNQVYFPIFDVKSKYEKKVDQNFSHLHPNILHRLESLQPFNLEKPEQSWLSLINKFDNDDKHRAAVATAPVAQGVSIHFGTASTFRFKAEEDPSASNEMRIDWTAPLISVPAGETLMTMTWIGQIEELPADSYALLSLDAVVPIEGEFIPAAVVAMDAASWAGAAINQICSGVITESGPVPLGPFQPPSREQNY